MLLAREQASGGLGWDSHSHRQSSPVLEDPMEWSRWLHVLGPWAHATSSLAQPGPP